MGPKSLPRNLAVSLTKHSFIFRNESYSGIGKGYIYEDAAGEREQGEGVSQKIRTVRSQQFLASLIPRPIPGPIFLTSRVRLSARGDHKVVLCR
ncbi:hypothetical protein TNCT_217391 [Trichonephila clavata]|uniref:Uncharacterized protein n=1 Tax=Trichonephila clavata TaxID=2740835 RepID=A0A8X6FE32_TRICU|nr:hypothetical protein TNCT_217391 [Trichonephila clavata]